MNNFIKINHVSYSLDDIRQFFHRADTDKRSNDPKKTHILVINYKDKSNESVILYDTKDNIRKIHDAILSHMNIITVDTIKI
jgi:hypothetical protein